MLAVWAEAFRALCTRCRCFGFGLSFGNQTTPVGTHTQALVDRQKALSRVLQCYTKVAVCEGLATCAAMLHTQLQVHKA